MFSCSQVEVVTNRTELIGEESNLQCTCGRGTQRFWEVLPEITHRHRPRAVSIRDAHPSLSMISTTNVCPAQRGPIATKTHITLHSRSDVQRITIPVCEIGITIPVIGAAGILIEHEFVTKCAIDRFSLPAYIIVYRHTNVGLNDQRKISDINTAPGTDVVAIQLLMLDQWAEIVVFDGVEEVHIGLSRVEPVAAGVVQQRRATCIAIHPFDVRRGTHGAF